MWYVVLDGMILLEKLIKLERDSVKAITQGTKAIASKGKPRTVRSHKSCLETVEGWKMCDLTMPPNSSPTERKSSENSQRGESLGRDSRKQRPQLSLGKMLSF